MITLGLVITKDPETGVPNVGVYRLQRQSINTATVHWLSVRGGARHLRKAAALGRKLEVAVAIGVHPLLVMAAATPIPVQLSEWLFAGLYAGEGVRLARCKTLDLEVPSHSEVVLEGTITPGEVLPDGPCGDHMGFYGGEEDSPLVRFHCVTQRRDPIFLTTFSGRPPKEEAMLAIALNRIYTPILRQQIPEIVDFFLPMEGLSYKLAVIAIDKAYPGQAKRAAMAFWSALPQFTYTKFVVVVDKSIAIRDPRQVIWAISAQVDPQRDLFVLEDTPSTRSTSPASGWGWAAGSPSTPPPRSARRNGTTGARPWAGMPPWRPGWIAAGASWASTIWAGASPIPPCSATPWSTCWSASRPAADAAPQRHLRPQGPAGAGPGSAALAVGERPGRGPGPARPDAGAADAQTAPGRPGGGPPGPAGATGCGVRPRRCPWRRSWRQWRPRPAA